MPYYDTDGGDPAFCYIVGRRQNTGVGTNAGVSVTIPVVGTSGLTICPVGIQFSGDAAAVVTVESPSGTALMTLRYAAAFADKVSFYPGAFQGAVDQAVVLKISASTAHCEAAIQAVVIPQQALDFPGNQLP